MPRQVIRHKCVKLMTATTRTTNCLLKFMMTVTLIKLYLRKLALYVSS